MTLSLGEQFPTFEGALCLHHAWPLTVKVPYSFKTSETASQQHTVLTHKTWNLKNAVICHYEINSARKTHNWKGFWESKLKTRQGKHLFSENYICHFFFNLIPYLCTVQISKYETCATWQFTRILFVVPIHDNSVYDSSLSGNPPPTHMRYVYMTLTCSCLHTYSLFYGILYTIHKLLCISLQYLLPTFW